MLPGADGLPGPQQLAGLHQVEQVMGMPVSLVIADDLPYRALTALADGVFGWLRLVDELFSTYRADSEISRLDRGAIRLRDCTPEVRAVIDRCAHFWGVTDGYFDVYATGRLDPSGYVKGWAVQVASDALKATGAPNHCINAGGDVRVSGHPVPGRPWRIGIRHPWHPAKVCWVLTGTDIAVATSGTYERGPHVIDPHRGRPATYLRSVTVVGADLGAADAYATAAVAMGAAGPSWLASLDGYESAVVSEDRQAFRSAGLPVQ
jgi:thiamine biosynthesis lipoprotein